MCDLIDVIIYSIYTVVVDVVVVVDVGVVQRKKKQ